MSLIGLILAQLWLNFTHILHSQRYKELLECGDRFDNTPLHVAAAKGHLEVVKILLSKEPDVDRKNEDEQTPLLVAAREGRPRYII